MKFVTSGFDIVTIYYEQFIYIHNDHMSTNKQKTAIILGATGLTGGLLLKRLLLDDTYTHIKLFSRRTVGFEHPKLTEYLGNVVSLEEFKQYFTGDAVFCCIGTTKAKTKDKAKYKAIDYGIPVKAARLAKDNGIGFVAVISAMGAKADSPFFYNRTKGEMENAVLAQRIPNTFLLRPSLIHGDRTESRTGEGIANILLSALDPLMVGCLKPYQRIHATAIAAAMHYLCDNPHVSQLNVIPSNKIKCLAQKSE